MKRVVLRKITIESAPRFISRKEALALYEMLRQKFSEDFEALKDA